MWIYTYVGPIRGSFPLLSCTGVLEEGENGYRFAIVMISTGVIEWEMLKEIVYRAKARTEGDIHKRGTGDAATAMPMIEEKRR